MLTSTSSPLKRPTNNQSLHRLRSRTYSRASKEDGQRSQHDGSSSPYVRQLGPDGARGSVGKQEGAADPGVASGGVEVRGDGGRGGRHDCSIEGGDKEGELGLLESDGWRSIGKVVRNGDDGKAIWNGRTNNAVTMATICNLLLFLPSLAIEILRSTSPVLNMFSSPPTPAVDVGDISISSSFISARKSCFFQNPALSLATLAIAAFYSDAGRTMHGDICAIYTYNREESASVKRLFQARHRLFGKPMIDDAGRSARHLHDSLAAMGMASALFAWGVGTKHVSCWGRWMAWSTFSSRVGDGRESFS